MNALHGLIVFAILGAAVWAVETYRLGKRADLFELHAEEACDLTADDIDDEYRTLCDRFAS